MSLKLFMPLAFLALALVSPSLGLARVGSTLFKNLETQQHANIFITMKDQLNLASLETRVYASRAEQITTLRDSLVQFASKSQKVLIEQIQASAKARSHPEFTTTSFWITNQLYVKDADAELVKLLMFNGDVAAIDEEMIVHLNNPTNVVQVSLEGKDGNTLANQWGIDKIGAPSVWSMSNGTEGQGIVVGIIDTGARSSHTILRNNYVNDGFSWFDAVARSSTPRDDHGHGTHVTGTIAGINGYGVAPKAKWISCKALDSEGSGSQSGLLACFQFMLCPTNPAGTTTDCSKAPRIVNNSWGARGGSTAFNSAIEKWHVAGIVPVFANGNEGQAGCSTVNSPADQNVIAVGATTNSDALAFFSSKGPTTRGNVKPDISAPGFPIMSAGHLSDTAYVSMQGTSMACPHVAGVLSLLLSYRPNLSYNDAKNILQRSAQQSLSFSSSTCGGIRDNTFPNNHFGYGRIDALAAVRLSDNYTPEVTTTTTPTPGAGSHVMASSFLVILAFTVFAKFFV